MALWKKLFGGSENVVRVAYYDEGLALVQDNKFHEALTSFRLALKESPGDTVVLQQIANVLLVGSAKLGHGNPNHLATFFFQEGFIRNG